ncbi:hypothetical protein ACFE04_022891 [Oxalis oulophora]
MVNKTKLRKSKPKKHPQNKHGKQVDMTQSRAQLDALELKIIQVEADGNCFFRALADQLEGNEEEHVKYRNMAVQYIVKNREMFEPFIEDEVPFDEYCQLMENDGTWAGHMELQAASLATRCNICIHRRMSPRWYIRNFDQYGARMIHLSYHDEEHYNSVRLKEDPCEGPAHPIIIKADADLSAKSDQAQSSVGKSKPGNGRDHIDARSIKMVISGSGCEDTQKVEEVLNLVDGDVDAAIEFLIAEKTPLSDELPAEHETNECTTEQASVSCHVHISHGNGNDVNGHSDEHGERPIDKTSDQHLPCTGSSKRVEEKIPRNKTCSCGSKKKHKSCCKAASGKSSTKSIVPTVETRKSKREKKQGKKGMFAKNVPSLGSDGPDLGIEKYYFSNRYAPHLLSTGYGGYPPQSKLEMLRSDTQSKCMESKRLQVWLQPFSGLTYSKNLKSFH